MLVSYQGFALHELSDEEDEMQDTIDHWVDWLHELALLREVELWWSWEWGVPSWVIMPSAAHGKKKESYKHKNHVDEELAAGLTALLPFLTQLEILPQTANVTDIDVDALKNLAGRW